MEHAGGVELIPERGRSPARIRDQKPQEALELGRGGVALQRKDRDVPTVQRFGQALRRGARILLLAAEQAVAQHTQAQHVARGHHSLELFLRLLESLDAQGVRRRICGQGLPRDGEIAQQVDEPVGGGVHGGGAILAHLPALRNRRFGTGRPPQ